MLFLSLPGILISTASKKEAAVVGFRICQGFGLAAVFLMDIYLTTLVKICVVGGVLAVGMVGYTVFEILRRFAGMRVHNGNPSTV
jgi:hypothetical protein